jgi:hypothetical protein
VATMPISHHDCLPNGVRDDPGILTLYTPRTYRDGRRRGDLLSHTPTFLIKLRREPLPSVTTHSLTWCFCCDMQVMRDRVHVTRHSLLWWDCLVHVQYTAMLAVITVHQSAMVLVITGDRVT